MYTPIDPPPPLVGNTEIDLMRLHEYLTELADSLEYSINKNGGNTSE